MQLIAKAPFTGRHNFGKFLEQRRAQTGVEVGTHRGEFARILLEKWTHGYLYCVDPYFSGYDNDDPASRGDRIIDHQIATRNLHPFMMRSAFILHPSSEAAKLQKLKDLDFVYIDAKHRYADVWHDLNTWWAQLKIGGILAGHDIVCPGDSDQWGHEIQPAVFEFAETHGVTVMLVTEVSDVPWSYYMVKE